jgi:hypothetical protein
MNQKQREKLERMLMLLAVATFHTPALQDERTELVEAGLKDLAAPVQEPVGDWVWSWIMDWCKRNGIAPSTQDNLFEMVKDSRNKFDTTPPAAQPAPVQEPVAFNAGVPLLYPEMKDGETISVEYTTPPAAQRQWVGLTDEEMNDITCGMVKGWVMERLAIAIEAKLKEKNT